MTEGAQWERGLGQQGFGKAEGWAAHRALREQGSEGSKVRPGEHQIQVLSNKEALTCFSRRGGSNLSRRPFSIHQDMRVHKHAS